MGADLVFVPCGSYDAQEVETALTAALEPLGGLDFVRPGMRVAVKVNLVSAMKPELAATVHPGLVCALVKLLKARGAEVVLGDSPGGVFTPAHLRHVYEVTGMRQAEELGAELNEDCSLAEADFPDGVQARHFPYTAYLTRADAIIDLCKLKSHGMMGMTNAVKNFFGAIPGTRKPEFHYRYPRAEDFADMLVDLYEFFRPRLCICDAVLGMEGNGPTQGTPRPIGCLIAGRSGHMLDMAAAGLIGLDPREVPTVRAAMERGLIPAKLSQLTVVGEPARFAVPDFQTVPAQSSVFFHVAGKGPVGKLADRAATRFMTPRPRLKAEDCIGCGRCAQICPAHAISMRRGRPRIERSVCIHCFCCQEFCPKGAMQVGRNFILRALGGRQT